MKFSTRNASKISSQRDDILTYKIYYLQKWFPTLLNTIKSITYIYNFILSKSEESLI